MKTIRIKDYYGIYQEIPVSDELYEEWRALQNETQRVHRKEVYHRDWTPIEDLFEMPKSYEQNPMEDTLLWMSRSLRCMQRSRSSPDPAAQDPHADGEYDDP